MADKKRLIDANALLDTVLNHFGVDLAYLGKDLQFCQEAIEFAPTVDAVEVAHGEWIMVIDENDCECIECPLCGGQFYDGDNDTFDKPYNYCPNCGAKMDEGEEV